MADRPLRPATDRRLGRPLPYQLANPTQAHLIARGPKIPRFALKRLCGISPSFPGLSPTNYIIKVDSYVLLTRPPLAVREQAPPAAVRLACVRHAASVQSEPESNSSIK